MKRRVATEVQFGKYGFIAYDLFVKHCSFTSATPMMSALRFCQ
ncbi:MAG TPA: hypothetical protein VGM03_24190 [Phycisphaerae bacterium]